MSNNIQNTLEAFFKLLEDADATTVDGGALLTGSETSDLTGEPENEVVRFSWTDGEHEFEVILTEGGISNGVFDSSGKFICEDRDGELTEVQFFALKCLTPFGTT